MSKLTQTVNQFFPALKARIDTLRMEIETGDSDKWRKLLQSQIDAGGFLKLEYAYGLAGEVQTAMYLVSKTGEAVRLNSGDFYRV